MSDVSDLKAPHNSFPLQAQCVGCDHVHDLSFNPMKDMTSETGFNRRFNPSLSLSSLAVNLPAECSFIHLLNASQTILPTLRATPLICQRADSFHLVCCDIDQVGGAFDQSHFEKALESIDHLLSRLYPITESMQHNMMTTLAQEKTEADSDAFLDVDYSDGIMPGLARHKNCNLSSNINDPCPKSSYEYYTSLEGQCLAVELISLILVCLIFHCLASIIYLPGVRNPSRVVALLVIRSFVDFVLLFLVFLIISSLACSLEILSA